MGAGLQENTGVVARMGLFDTLCGVHSEAIDVESALVALGSSLATRPSGRLLLAASPAGGKHRVDMRFVNMSYMHALDSCGNGFVSGCMWCVLELVLVRDCSGSVVNS